MNTKELEKMKWQNVHVILILIIISMIFHFARCEYFTAVSDMKILLRTVEKIARSLEKYLQVEEERLEKIKRHGQKYSRLNSIANKNEEFLWNPVNAYLLVRKLTTDWGKISRLIGNENSKAIIDNVKGKVSLPSGEDLSGAETALVILQEMYLLNTTTIVSGRIKGALPSEELSAAECFDLGLQAYTIKRYNLSLSWMKEALERIKKENPPTVDKIRIMEYLSYASLEMKKYKTSFRYAQELMTLFPNYNGSLRSVKFYQNYSKEFVEDEPELENIDTEKPLTNGQAYNKLCRGESIKTPKEMSQLYCYYATNKSSYLVLEQVKVEVLNIKPKLLMYHHIISDKEVEIIKNLSLPKLSRSSVVKSQNQSEHSYFRISKGTWLKYWDHPLLAKLYQRIEDITGLDYYYAENLYVINYGIGGYYDIHLDYLEDDTLNLYFEEIGNRLATLIFYLSNVPAGGSTVFPNLGVEVKPVKGAAAFWYNLKQNGTGDAKTIHGACPVLVGSKWVANLWFHERGNEFKRQCSLDPFE